MFDHLGLNVSDYETSKTFYEKALAPLGITFLFTLPLDQTDGEQVGSFGLESPVFWIYGTSAQNPPIHLAFAAENRKSVDAFHAAALKAGGTDNGGPGLRPEYHENYYGAFVLDADGNNIEAVCHTPE